jgi:diguanylate cyclase (GGDEF)-like protein
MSYNYYYKVTVFLNDHYGGFIMLLPVEAQIKPFIFLVIAVSIISLVIIYSKTNINLGNKREIVAFRGMLISFMVFSFIDFRQLWGESFFVRFPSFFTGMVIAIGFTAMSFSCYFWFRHVFASLHIRSSAPKIGIIPIWKILIHIPLAICLILLFTPAHVIVYNTSDPATVFQPGALLLLLLDYVYLILATCISVYFRRRAQTKIEKRKYTSQTIFILLFTISGSLIGFLINFPAIELCFIPIVLKLFVNLQDSQIYTDVLTKLYNRRRMSDFLSQEIATCSPKNPLTIIMIDMDYFKSINDILGHDEGDKALVSFSNAIMRSVRSRNAIAARWGGDEFVVAGKDKSLPLEFKDSLKTEVDNIKKLSYTPPFSIGIYVCTSPDTTVEYALNKADEALYQDKELQHQTSADFVNNLKVLKQNLA